MAKAIECDRCKRKDGIPRPGEIVTIPDGVTDKWLFLYRDRDLRCGYESGIDLCPNCAKRFEEFMQEVKES